MKKNSTSQSAPARRSLGEGGFFNLRVLIGLLTALAGVFLALLGVGTFSAQAQQYNASMDPLVPAMFDCSKIDELGIDKQENMRAGAIMIFCGRAEGGKPAPSGALSQLVKELLPEPLAYGAVDVNLITGTETSPNVTQSETYSLVSPENPQHIVVAFNDSRGRNASPINISGASVSTDGGASFTRLTNASGQSPFSNTVGDPVVLYNSPTDTWFTVWLDGGCGAQGLGGYKSTTPWDPLSWTHFCVHTGSSDDRESGWSDNNPASPFFGRMYVSWNDFARGQGIFVRFTTDNGLTWTQERQVSTTFFRNVQITGDRTNGDVYIAAMDEMGGNANFNRANKIYRSTDGGNTWANTFTGPTFRGPGRTNSGFFACMYSSPAYWRHMGWGQPAAFNQIVSYVYASGVLGGDPGNIFYIRSTNRGVTWSAPVQLNTDLDTTKAQWMPNLSVSDNGTLFATWYDETPRVAASCQPSSPATPCYQMYSRKSNDNGVTWLAPDTLSDVASPLPLQSDPGIQALYAGDYDYGSAVATKHVTAWVDGRNPIAGASQQNAYTDREPVSQSPTPTPTATPTPTVTPTATPTPTPGQCFVPNFIETRIRNATQTWVAAGFNSNNITTIGHPGQKITSQSLPAGFVGDCGTTTITVSH